MNWEHLTDKNNIKTSLEWLRSNKSENLRKLKLKVPLSALELYLIE